MESIESLLRCHRDYHRSQSCHDASAEFQFRRPNLARDLRKVNHSPTAVPDELTEVSRGLFTCARVPEGGCVKT